MSALPHARDTLVEVYFRSVAVRMSELLGVRLYWRQMSSDRGAIYSTTQVTHTLSVSLLDDASWHVVPNFETVLHPDLWPMPSFGAIGLPPPRTMLYRRTQESQYVARRLAHMWTQAAKTSAQISAIVDDRIAHRDWIADIAGRFDLIALHNDDLHIGEDDALKLHGRAVEGRVRNYEHIVVRLLTAQRIDVKVHGIPPASLSLADTIVLATRAQRYTNERNDGATT